MTTLEERNDVSEYMPEISPYDHMQPVKIEEANALERVSSLPLVANTWDAVSSYYASAKKSYPSVTPFLELAEKLTSGAAHVAMTTTRPVVGRIAPTVNTYANRGLDKLEDALPMIRDQPDEIYDTTKAAVTSMVNRRIDRALSVTENYVDYYLPPIEDEDDNSDEEDNSDSDDDSDTSSFTEDYMQSSPKDRISIISHKVRERAYRRAMDRVNGVQKRSRDTLTKLKFTVDLIQYAKENLDATRGRVMSTVNSANETIWQSVTTYQENVGNVWVEIKTRSSNTAAELHVLQVARRLTHQLQKSCASLLTVVTNLPQYEYLRSQILKAKESADALARSLADKSSVRDLSLTLTSTAYDQIENVGKILDSLFEVFTEHVPLKWLQTSKSVSEEDKQQKMM